MRSFRSVPISSPGEVRFSLIDEPEHPALVIIDRRAIGGVGELRSIAAVLVLSVRRLSASEVHQLTGLSAPAGGIEVVLGR